MNKTDVILLQDPLKPACESQQSCNLHTDAMQNGEPSTGKSHNDKDKQSPNASVVVNSAKSKPTKFNGNSKEQRTPSSHKNPKKVRRFKWKPYHKLSWEERKKLEERETRRAERNRERLYSCGIALAPYNTTQFLMEDHNLQEPDYEHIPVSNHWRSSDSSEEYYSSPEDEEDFLQQQFAETYRNLYVEKLSGMSKGELVQELMSLEDKVEVLQKRLEDLPAAESSEHFVKNQESRDYDHEEQQLEKIRVFKEEILKLKEENVRRRRENESLRRCLKL